MSLNHEAQRVSQFRYLIVVENLDAVYALITSIANAERANNIAMMIER